MGGQLWTTESSEALAAEIVDSIEIRPDLFSRLDETIEQMRGESSTMECLPAALLEKVPRQNWQDRLLLREALRRLHLRKSSGLSEGDDERLELGGSDLDS